LIKKVLFDGLTDLLQIQALFAQCSLQANLKNLLCKLLVEKIPQFKKTLVEEQSKRIFLLFKFNFIFQFLKKILLRKM
jgi:hypothetical protein